MVELSTCRNIPGNFTRQLRQNCKHTNKYRTSLGQKNDTSSAGLVLHKFQVLISIPARLACSYGLLCPPTGLPPPNLLSVFPPHLDACHCGLELHLRDEVALATRCSFSPTCSELPSQMSSFSFFLDYFIASGPRNSFSHALHFQKKK